MYRFHVRSCRGVLFRESCLRLNSLKMSLDLLWQIDFPGEVSLVVIMGSSVNVIDPNVVVVVGALANSISL